jgi:hypothetical protein
MSLGRKFGRKIQGRDFEIGNVQVIRTIEEAFPGIENPIPEREGPDEPPSLIVASQPLHRHTSCTFTSGSQAKSSSIAPTERQQEVRERAESMRDGISALEAALLNEHIPEEQRRDAQAELQQLRSMMALFSQMEQSDWARGLVDEPPPAYNTLLGR